MTHSKHDITEHELLKGFNPGEYVYISKLYYQYDVSVRDTILEIINYCLYRKKDLYRKRNNLIATLADNIESKRQTLDGLKYSCEEKEKLYLELQEKVKLEEKKLQDLQKELEEKVPNICEELIKKHEKKIQKLNKIKKCY
jgi:hypothetical protein